MRCGFLVERRSADADSLRLVGATPLEVVVPAQPIPYWTLEDSSVYVQRGWVSDAAKQESSAGHTATPCAIREDLGQGPTLSTKMHKFRTRACARSKSCAHLLNQPRLMLRSEQPFRARDCTRKKQRHGAGPSGMPSTSTSAFANTVTSHV